jgi:hypothetical protein
MTLRLNGSTSGYTEIDAPAVAGSNTLRLPTGNGSDGNILGTDGAGNLSWVNGRMVLATAQNTTSGTNIDFTGIPSWAKRVTVMFNGVSTNGSSGVGLRVGAGSIVSSGYNGNVSFYNINSFTSSARTAFSTDFRLIGSTASNTLNGVLQLLLLSGNTYVITGIVDSTDYPCTYSGNITLSGTLDRLRLTTVNGTDTFDAGSINILYEG